MAEQQRVPNLEELDEEEAYSFLTEVFFSGPIPDPDVVYEANHPGHYIMEMPQSGEAVRGREHEELSGGLPRLALYTRAPSTRQGGLWVVEAVSDYSGQVSDMVMILELKDERIWRDRRY